MFNKKCALSFLLALALTGCAAKSASNEEAADDGMLYLEALQGTASGAQNQASAVKTTVVERGTITTRYALDASRLFPFGTDITYENAYADITFEECLVDAGDFVTTGQPLVVLKQTVDEIDAEEAQMTYDRTKAAFAVMCEDYESRLLDLTEDGYEYALLEYEYEAYREETDSTLEALSKQLEAYEEIRQNPEITVTASADGYVQSVINRVQGERVESEESLVELLDSSVWYYTLEDTAASIPIGQTVTLREDLEDQSELVIQGYIVCANMALEQSERVDYALIKPETVLLDGEDVTGQVEAAILPTRMSVELCQLELSDVLVVSQDYVYQEGSQYYVYLMEKGEQVKTYVVCLMASVNGKSWILSGVEEGDVLAMQ